MLDIKGSQGKPYLTTLWIFHKQLETNYYRNFEKKDKFLEKLALMNYLQDSFEKYWEHINMPIDQPLPTELAQKLDFIKKTYPTKATQAIPSQPANVSKANGPVLVFSSRLGIHPTTETTSNGLKETEDLFKDIVRTTRGPYKCGVCSLPKKTQCKCLLTKRSGPDLQADTNKIAKV
jgi:hypothetical protein